MKNSPIFCTRKHKGLLLALFALLCISIGMSLCLGAVKISLGDTLRVLTGGLPGSVTGQILLLARLPRTCGCLLAGGALAVSGAVIQSVLHNPLAAPNIIGVNTGAGLAVTLCGAFLPNRIALMPLAAFLGAFLSAMLVLAIANRTGASRMTLVLAGIAISSILGAGIDALVTVFPDVLTGYSDFRIGGMSNLSMKRILPALWVVLPALLLLLALGNEMDILSLGTETARSLGLPAERMQRVLLGLAAALAGAAVSFCGLLGFVGLIVPHIMRRLTGEGSRVLIAASGLGGAVLLTLCDLLSRTLFAPFELPVGIALAWIGGPFFIWLLLRQRGGRIHD